MSDSSTRTALMSRLGPFPQRVPLQLEQEEPATQEDHSRALVSYAVEPGERVTAWLLRPAGAPPPGGWPAILAIHQHGGIFDLGKSEPAGLSADATYHYGLDLCRRGYVVLCPDQLCFEDRRPPAAVRKANPMQEGTNYERFEFKRRLLAGACLQTKYLHDMAAALDLLEALPEVDNKRIGAFGHSLGGQEALWLMWYDPRIRAAACSCGFGQIATLLRDGINHNYALYVPGMLQVGDMEVIMAALAPRPFMVTAGIEDHIFPIDGVRAVAEQTATAYKMAGAPERFQALIFQGGHSLPPEAKRAAYGFLDRWLS
jgi:dienelactone hydrolase